MLLPALSDKDGDNLQNSVLAIWGQHNVFQGKNYYLILEMLMIDSTAVRAHQHAAGAQNKKVPKR
ncbi:hypothetical protein KDM88_12195 [Undibacterium sp. BYS50W]|nr:hypothetical protein [Undibacterium rugosum]